MPSTKTTKLTAENALTGVLGQLRATSWLGFEGLVIALLREATQFPLVLAGSGVQGGLDAATPRSHSIQIAVECKRYGESTPLSERELRSEIEIACARNPNLDCWILVTSRQVTTQEDAVLADACQERGIGYLSLGCGTSINVGNLEALCAGYESAAVAYLTAMSVVGLIPEFHAAVAAVRGRVQFLPTLAALTASLQQADIGFANFALALNTRLLQDIADRVTCKRRFRCALTPASLRSPLTPLRRTAALERLTRLWAESNTRQKLSVVLVKGEEGTGKSWVVADWVGALAKASDAPAIFYIPASEPESKEAQRVLIKHARDFALTTSTDASVERKIERWLGVDVLSSGKRAIVVLDGINERLDIGLWADLIEEFGSSRFSSVHLVITCRSRTWRERFSKSIGGSFSIVEIEDFNEIEFTQLISGLTPEQRQAIRSAGPLVRRPRYFHLALQRVAELRPGEELTAEDLYYFDWQHRESLKRGMALDGIDFAEAIRRLAHDQRADRHFDRARLESVLGASRFTERQEELASSGVIERTADGWRLKHEYFALGLGMYLAARLEEHGGSIAERCNEADDVLGDTSSFDLTTSVLQHALLHTLISEHPYSTTTKISLLSIWSRALNSSNALGTSLPQLQVAPELLLDFAEHHWGQPTSSHVMEQAILAALVRMMRIEATQQLCEDRLVRWASLVHERGESEQSTDDAKERVCEDVIRLCAKSECLFPASGVVLRHEAVQPLLRLGRLAIAAVSATSVRRFWRVVETAFVADQTLRGVRTDLLAWLIRWSHEPLDDLVDSTVTALIQDADPVCLRAAQRMISILGSKALLPRFAEIAPKHFPTSPWATVSGEPDPCLSFFRPPTPQQLPSCLDRDDVPSHFKVDRAKMYAADLAFPFPSSFASQIQGDVERIDVSKLRLHMGQSEVDHTLEQRQALASRLVPEAFAGLVRRLAKDCSSRSGDPLRQVSFELDEHAALLDEESVESVRIALQRLSEGNGVKVRDAVFVETMLASTILHHLGPQEQLEFLRSRGPDAAERTTMSLLFRQLPVEQQGVLAQWTEDAHALRLALWFLAAQEHLDEPTVTILVEAAIRCADSATRGLALRIAMRLRPDQRRRLVRVHRHGREQQTTAIECFYRTLAAVVCELPDAEILPCITPEYLGEALRDFADEVSPTWISYFGDLAVRAMEASIARSNSRTAPTEVDCGRSLTPWCRTSTPRSHSNSTTMFSPLSTWGGLPEGSFGSIFEDDDASTRQSDALEQALADAKADGDWLFAAYIPAEAVGLLALHAASVFDRAIDLIEEAASADLLSRVQAVAEATVEWALASGHTWALRGYDLLESTPLPTRYEDRVSGMLRRHSAIMRIKPSADVELRWRSLIDEPQNDLDLYRVLSALASSNGEWLVKEGSVQLANGSPRGRALALIYTSAVDGADEAVASVQQLLCGDQDSWYVGLARMAEQYVSRGRDQRHWLEEALLSEDPIVRSRGAVLVKHIGHPTLGRDIERALNSKHCLSLDGSRLSPLPPYNGRRGQVSGWAKNMSERLLGSRKLEHAASPWLPDAIR